MTLPLTYFAAACEAGKDTAGQVLNFFAFPTWYKYLEGQTITSNGAAECAPKITKIGDAWLVLAAVIEIMLRVGALIAIAFVIYGGISFITSEGQPDKASKARSTVINAVIGLALSISASAVISFIARSF